MKEQTFHHTEWKWIETEFSKETTLEELTKQYKQCGQWIMDVKENKLNKLKMDITAENKESVWGSLIYLQDIQEQNKQHLFHFFITKDFLITGHLDFNLLDEVDEKELKKMLEQASTPIEGFMIILGSIVSSFFQEIDTFEERLSDLLWKVKKKNNKKILEKIVDCKHEILVWKNLIIPFIEIRMAMLEAFGDDVQEGIHYKRTCRRIERCHILVREYEQEIGAMVNLENVVSSLRGNEIMKTLTVMTVLFTPVMAWGALWGMNFDEHMPELKWKYGYLASMGIIAVTTGYLFLFLKKKGWTGEILKGNKNKSFLD
ncbi:magnesium transporter CorA family protein [Jeotgalibacillus soli]|uniref:Mg2+ transporter protein, CorA-like protein n=1 Tax=Jeotgalibacillus soli TaxID=889306 RepID=A0A0C2VXV2_9BACL|nr:magnesium transporter CorA family protein [Jeotgalibacillus soli]KIL49251.1 hypothetical protein KP78_07190 [Jeotgalibacillus soli]